MILSQQEIEELEHCINVCSDEGGDEQSVEIDQRALDKIKAVNRWLFIVFIFGFSLVFFTALFIIQATTWKY